MEIENTFISGLKLIHLNKFTDNRGCFLKVFNEGFFAENGLETNYKESYFSISHKDIIRGMHFQVPPGEHVKLIYLSQGKILDVILDIRSTSSTYGKYFTIELDSSNPILIYIPIGCAHGFLSLEENSILTYLQTSVYKIECDQGIKYDSFGMNWGVNNPIVSNRDVAFKDFDQFKTPF